jgi:hypothetical protein
MARITAEAGRPLRRFARRHTITIRQPSVISRQLRRPLFIDLSKIEHVAIPKWAILE